MGPLLRLFGSWLIQSVVLKFISFSVLYLIVSAFSNYLLNKLTIFNPGSIFSSVYQLSPQIWYLLDLTAFREGFPMIISASILAFAIRRMPVIG